MEKRIEMSEREIERLKVLDRLREGVISQRQAAAQLRLAERQVRRLKRRYEREGAAGLIVDAAASPRTGARQRPSRQRS